MRLTRAADYAIRVMIHLATFAPGDRVKRTEIVAASRCPEKLLSKVLQSLTRACLVTSYRGKSGGYELASAGRHASILEIVEALDGPIHLNACTGPEPDCPLQPTCPAHHVWIEAQSALVGVLERAKIENLAGLESRIAQGA
jgi:Rrf2 family protein